VFKEFRGPSTKGSVDDLANGGIVRAAFGVIVSSLIDDVVMPVVGLALGRSGVSSLVPVPGNPNSVPLTSLAAAMAPSEVVRNIGLFTNAVVSSSLSPWCCSVSSGASIV
jgi:large conductance mechanosensitive channel